MATLRSSLIRLAHQNPELRPHLLPLLSVDKQAALSLKKELITPATASAKPLPPMEALTVGPWAIHKNIKGSGYAVTFTPTGHALSTKAKTLTDAKAFLETLIEREPSLMHANDLNDVMSHKVMILDLVKNPPWGPAPLTLGEKRDLVRGWLIQEGLRSKGSRSGKAGEFFYHPESGGGFAPSRAIALGSRDLILNEYRNDESWGLVNSELISKVTLDLVKKWATWAASGPTRKELRG